MLEHGMGGNGTIRRGAIGGGAGYTVFNSAFDFFYVTVLFRFFPLTYYLMQLILI